MRQEPMQRQDRHAAYMAMLLLPLLLSSCTVRLVASYDEYIDRSATELQQEMDRHLTRLEGRESTPDAEYAANRDFYSEYAVRLRSVRARAHGHKKNQITIDQLDLMERSLEELRSQHEEAGTLSTGYITTVRELFNTSWSAIIAWEMAKKRGEG